MNFHVHMLDWKEDSLLEGNGRAVVLGENSFNVLNVRTATREAQSNRTLIPLWEIDLSYSHPADKPLDDAAFEAMRRPVICMADIIVSRAQQLLAEAGDDAPGVSMVIRTLPTVIVGDIEQGQLFKLLFYMKLGLGVVFGGPPREYKQLPLESAAKGYFPPYPAKGDLSYIPGLARYAKGLQRQMRVALLGEIYG